VFNRKVGWTTRSWSWRSGSRDSVPKPSAPPTVLDKMRQHPLTKIGLENFLADWEKHKAENLDIKI